LSTDAGATEGGGAGGNGGLPEGGPDTETEGGPDAGAGGGPNVDGGTAADRIVLDAVDADDGTKGPFPVADAGGTPRGIAEHDTDLYWVQSDTNAGVVRAPKNGGQPPASFQIIDNAFDVAVDANYVYWSTGKGPTGNQVFRKSILASTGASGELVFPGAGETLFLAVGTGGRVFATGADAIAVGPRVDAGISDVLYQPQQGAAGIAISGTDLFWSVATGIVRGVDNGQSASQRVYDGKPGEVGGIATDGQEIYWIASDGAVRAILVNNPSGAPPREVCRASNEPSDAAIDARPDGAGSDAVADIAVDDAWVYFTEPAVRRISKCQKR
jgi:hypothetical protein